MTVTTVNARLGTVTNGTAGSTSGGLTSFNLTGGTMSGAGTYNFNVAAATPPTITTNASVALSTISSGVVIQNGWYAGPQRGLRPDRAGPPYRE